MGRGRRGHDWNAGEGGGSLECSRALPNPLSFAAAYRQSVLDFVKAVGLTGVETDGQYEDYACADAGGDHHHNGLEGSWGAQMAATASFNEQLKQLGVYQTGADAYLFSGANCAWGQGQPEGISCGRWPTDRALRASSSVQSGTMQTPTPGTTCPASGSG